MDQSDTFWDRLRKNVSVGFRVAADRTDELARVGKLKLDLLSVKRKLTHEFSEIGRAFYTHTTDHKKKDWGSIDDFSEQPAIKEMREKAASLLKNIRQIEADIAEISAESKSKHTQESGDIQPIKTPPIESDDSTE